MSKTPSKARGQRPRSQPPAKTQSRARGSVVDPASRVERVADELDSLVHYVDTPDVSSEAPPPAAAENLASDEGTFADLRLAPMLVRASAGTGKTYRLTARLLKILLQGAAPESILATTFTRKAAGEILDRVLLTLARAADEDDDQALQALREQVGIPTLPRSVCLQLLRTLLSSIHRIRICTLDSFFAQLARSFPFELKLPPAWRLTDEIEEHWLEERAIDAVVTALDHAEMTTVLSLLGKGDIKRSVARELHQVVDAAYSRQRGCRQDAWERVTVPSQPDDATLSGAVASFRASTPRQKRLQSKLQELADAMERRDFADLADERLIQNIAAARRDRSEVTYYRSKFPDGLDPAFDALYASVRSQVLRQLRAQNEATGSILSIYDHHVTHIKEASRALGFDDVSVRLAREFATLDQREFRMRMDGAIDHLLLDEFQDTSPVQWQVLRPLVSRVAAYEADLENEQNGWQVPRSFFCVGDTKQAIYGWRGGVAEIFDAVSDQIEGITEVNQDKSYRSSPVIVDVVNRSFRNLPRHPSFADSAEHKSPKEVFESEAVRRFARRFPEHHTERTRLPGFFRFQTSRRVEGDADARRLACFEDAARTVAELHERSAGTIGVLTRTNQAVAQLIFLLERLGVDVSQEGGNPLTDSAAVELVLSALMMAEHPGDGRWSFHVQHSPLGEIPGMSPALVRRMVEHQGLADAIEELGARLAPHCDARESLRLRQLTHLAIETQPLEFSRLRDFVRLVREKRVERPRAAAVRVMTVHQAKGLEFDAVVLPELDAPLSRSSTPCVSDTPVVGQPPQAMSRYLNHRSWHFLSEAWQRAFGQQAAASMTEALCLLYVAVTRARQVLQVIVQPATKPDFVQRTSASLLYHALGCDQDPTEGGATLFEEGSRDCLASRTNGDDNGSTPTVEARRIQFRSTKSASRNEQGGEA